MLYSIYYGDRMFVTRVQPAIFVLEQTTEEGEKDKVIPKFLFLLLMARQFQLADDSETHVKLMLYLCTMGNETWNKLLAAY